MRGRRYRAPELLLTCSEYGYEVDVWSGGPGPDPAVPAAPALTRADPAWPRPGLAQTRAEVWSALLLLPVRPIASAMDSLRRVTRRRTNR